MKFFSLPSLLAAALFGAGVVLPFQPWTRTKSAQFSLEARIAADAPGHAQLFYDLGVGFNEQDSTRLPIAAGKPGQVYRFSLPPGSYRKLRFDPSENATTFELGSIRIVAENGRTLRTIEPREWRAGDQIQSLRPHSEGLEIRMRPGATDPQIDLTFPSTLRIDVPWGERLGNTALSAGVVWILVALLLFVLDRAAKARDALNRGARWGLAHPGRAVAVLALIAVVISVYPVVFLGKSHVSPNLGTTLLYDGFPTLPGDRSTETTDVKGSDVGAVMWQHVPFSMMQHRALFRDGELPLWNRYNSGGTPLLAQGQSMFGDPLHFLVVIANGAAWAWDAKYLIAKWLFATGLGLIVFALTRHLPSALLVTFGAPFIGFFVYRVDHPAFFSFCYSPWVLYCWVRIVQSETKRATACWMAGLVLVNFALLNSGTVKEAYMLLLSLNFSGACVLLSDRASLRVRLLKLAGLVWAGAIFALLSAPIWLPFLDTLKRAYTSYNAVVAFQVQPGLLLAAFDEALYRPLSDFSRVFNPSANFLILGGVLYFLATLRLHFAERPAVALAVASLVPLSLAFGLIPSAWIVDVPFLGNIHHLDNSFTCVLIVLWAVLAGMGFKTAATRLGTPEGRGDLIVAALLLFALVFAYVGFGQAVQRAVFGAGTTFAPIKTGQEVRMTSFVWGYLGAMLTALVAGGIIVRRALIRRQLTPAAGVLLALALSVLLWRHAQHGRAAGFEDYVVRPTPRANFHAKSEAIAFVQAAQSAAPSRAVGTNQNFFPGWTGAYDLESINGPDALMSPYYRELTSQPGTGIERIWDWRLYVTPATVGPSQRFLDFLNVRYYFDLHSDQGRMGAVLKPAKLADLDVYESPTAWPRAFFTDRLFAYREPAELVQKIVGPDRQPFAAALAADIAAQPSLAALPSDLAGRTTTPATGYRLTVNTTSFDVRASGPGAIVLGEVLWPGDFRAEINGQSAPVVRLNHAFKGVVVSGAGEYRVTFRYWPRRFSLALGLSLAGFILLGISFVAVWKWTPRATGSLPAA
jgi:hypothetical protein